MAKEKKLTLSVYNKLNKQFNERKTIHLQVNDGNDTKEFTHTIATKFKPTDIQKLQIDYMTLLMELQNEKDITKETFINATSILNALVVQYFTDIPIPPIDNLQSIIHVSEVFYNLGIMQQLFDGENGFSKEEIEKLSVEMDKNHKAYGERFGELLLKSALDETGDSDAIVQ